MVKIKAFSLIELLLVLAVAAVLCVLAVPSYHALIQRTYADSTMAQLYRAIQLARSEAIKFNTMITICPSEDGKLCSTDWSKGYLLFIDWDGNGIMDSKDQRLKFFLPVAGKGILTWTNFRRKPFLQLTPMGFTNGQNGTFLYCPFDHDAKQARALFVAQSGKVRFSQDKNDDGVHEKSNGVDLVC